MKSCIIIFKIMLAGKWLMNKIVQANENISSLLFFHMICYHNIYSKRFSQGKCVSKFYFHGIFN